MPQTCANCDTPLAGEYCHACGQRRLDGRLTLSTFVEDVARRVFRFDKALVVTLARMIRSPGRLVNDYLEGRRAGILDPLQFFISSVFVQIVVSALVRSVAPLIHRDSAMTWLSELGGVVAVKVLVIFWMATIWRLMFRARRYNLAEIYVFATYAFGVTGLLWALLPLIDLAVPMSLGVNSMTVTLVTLGIEVLFMTYAVSQFASLQPFIAFARVSVVLAVGYGLLFALVGLERMVPLLLPPMPPP